MGLALGSLATKYLLMQPRATFSALAKFMLVDGRLPQRTSQGQFLLLYLQPLTPDSRSPHTPQGGL